MKQVAVQTVTVTSQLERILSKQRIVVQTFRMIIVLATVAKIFCLFIVNEQRKKEKGCLII